MRKTVIQNIVFDTPFRTDEARSLCFRSQGGKATVVGKTLVFEGSVDFLTYFNALSIAKWRSYTVVQDFLLRLEVEGAPCRLSWHVADDDGEARELGEKTILKEGSVELVVPNVEARLVGFSLEADGTTTLKGACFLAEAEASSLRRVELALCTTTFRKEEYVKANIAAIREEVLASSDAISSHFSMFVVDNGRTLDAAALSGEGVTVIPNDNVGGAGGFARGMMAAMDSSRNITHVLLMDDDVRVSPESFKRVHALLSLVDDAHADSFVEGAMLKMERPTVQFEDVSRVDRSGVYERLKHDLAMDCLSDVAKSEGVDLDAGQTYGAWWFCCIPVKAIERTGLPLPLFVRCDDVEYGMRNNASFMALNGICVWHEGFGGRFRPSVDCYHYVRNFLVMIAVDECASERMFLARCERNVRIYLRTMNYDAADLLLDGWEDYLKGPSFLKESDGETIMREKGAKNERLVPIDEIDVPGGRETLLRCDPDVLNPEWASPLALKLWRALPYDRHCLPDFVLRDDSAAICYSGCAKPSVRTVGTSTLLAVDETGKNAALRKIDKERYRAIKRRWRSIRDKHERTGEAVARAYREAMPELTSRGFWESYLGLD